MVGLRHLHLSLDADLQPNRGVRGVPCMQALHAERVPVCSRVAKCVVLSLQLHDPPLVCFAVAWFPLQRRH